MMGRSGTRLLLSFAALALFSYSASFADADENILGLPEMAGPASGSLVICGGGDLPDEIYDEFIRLAGGTEARIIVIPTAWPYASMGAIEYRYAGWRRAEVESVEFLDTNSRVDANSPEFLRPLTKATGVWIAGGVQGRLADLFAGTRLEDEIKDVVRRGGVVGGTSAGASIMSRVMIRTGSSSAAKIDRGLGLLSRAVIDQHFTQRRRLERLLGVIQENPEQIGLGIDENTALIVEGNQLRVIGQSRVTVCIGRGFDTPVVRRLKTGDEAELLVRSSENHPGNTVVLRTTRREREVVARQPDGGTGQ
jgi:cyanophycinase